MLDMTSTQAVVIAVLLREQRAPTYANAFLKAWLPYLPASFRHISMSSFRTHEPTYESLSSDVKAARMTPSRYSETKTTRPIGSLARTSWPTSVSPTLGMKSLWSLPQRKAPRRFNQRQARQGIPQSRGGRSLSCSRWLCSTDKVKFSKSYC